MATSVSTLSTGLNKSDEFIKNNAIQLHTRIVTFKNREKIHTKEHTAIPAADDPDGTARYVRCESFTYFPDYDICHKDVQIRWQNGNATTTKMVTKENINKKGIVTAIAEVLQLAHIFILFDVGNDAYQGIKFSWNNGAVVSLSFMYLASWLLGIVGTYTYDQENTFYTMYDNWQVGNTVNVLNFNNGITTISVYPLINGGNNKLMVSGDDLATS